MTTRATRLQHTLAIAVLCCVTRTVDATPTAAPTASASAPTATATANAASASASAPSAAASAPAAAAPGTLLDAIASGDTAAIERAVGAVAALAPEDVDPDALFAAARACEDKLLDPGRAVVLYERLIAAHPTARAATAAGRRARLLRAQVGPNGEAAALAAELARLVARADGLAADDVTERADRLAAAAWPGAPAAALWLADWLRRSRRFDAAQARYAAVIARWPERPEAQAALRGATGCALDARDWALADTLARRLPVATAADRAVRDDLLDEAARGRRRGHWYAGAWIALFGALAGLAGSLLEAALRSPAGTRRSALRPPLEAVFLVPVAVVLIGVAFTTHRLIAPAVTTIAAGGLALTWLSGAALERLRVHGRSSRLRTAGHVAACVAGVAALAYIAVTRDHLIDMLIETVRFGPER
jgi:hypothetical protein